jgi:hypothetical protein
MHSRTIGCRKADECASAGQKTIEIKTRSFERGHHLTRVRELAAWLSRRRRRWARNGALGVMCVVHARRVEHVEDGVLIVSPDRLIGALRTAAGTRERPAFLAAPAPPQS